MNVSYILHIIPLLTTAGSVQANSGKEKSSHRYRIIIAQNIDRRTWQLISIKIDSPNYFIRQTYIFIARCHCCKKIQDMRVREYVGVSFQIHFFITFLVSNNSWNWCVLAVFVYWLFHTNILFHEISNHFNNFHIIQFFSSPNYKHEKSLNKFCSLNWKWAVRLIFSDSFSFFFMCLLSTFSMNDSNWCKWLMLPIYGDSDGIN